MPPPLPVTQDPALDFDPLLAAARAGDAEALEALFRAFYPRVEEMVHRSLAKDLRRSRPWLLARFSTGDVVQEVFRQLLQDLSGFQGEGERAFCGYLAMVVRNRLVDAIRFHQAGQRDGRRGSALPDGMDPTAEQDGPGTAAAGLEEAERLRRVLADLPEREQLLVRGRLEEERTFQELAEALGYPSKHTARRAFYAAQARLVIRMQQDEEGEA